MTFVIVLLLLGLNSPFRYEESYSNKAECIKAAIQWRAVKEAQIIMECVGTPKVREKIIDLEKA